MRENISKIIDIMEEIFFNNLFHVFAVTCFLQYAANSVTVTQKYLLHAAKVKLTLNKHF